MNLTPGQWRGLPSVHAMFGSGCEACDQTGHVCADDGTDDGTPEGTRPPGGHHHGDLHPWDGLSVRADACDHGGGAPCPRCSPRSTPPLLERLRAFRLTASGCWSDAEIAVSALADGLDVVGDRLGELADWCHRRGVAAKHGRVGAQVTAGSWSMNEVLARFGRAPVEGGEHR